MFNKRNKKKEDFITIRIPKRYIVDFDKVKDFNDLKNVVQILFAGLPVVISGNCNFVDDVKEYLVEVE